MDKYIGTVKSLCNELTIYYRMSKNKYSKLYRKLVCKYKLSKIKKSLFKVEDVVVLSKDLFIEYLDNLYRSYPEGYSSCNSILTFTMEPVRSYCFNFDYTEVYDPVRYNVFVNKDIDDVIDIKIVNVDNKVHITFYDISDISIKNEYNPYLKYFASIVLKDIDKFIKDILERTELVWEE